MPVIPGVAGTVPYSIFLIFIAYIISMRISMAVLIVNFSALLFISAFLLINDSRMLANYLLLLVGPNVFIYLYLAKTTPSIRSLRVFILSSFVLSIAFEFELMTQMGRGVSGLYDEPSHFGRYLLTAILIFSLLNENITRVQIFYKYILPLFFINRSASTAVLFLIYFFAKIKLKDFYYWIFFGITAIVFYLYFNEFRFVKQFVIIFDLLQSDNFLDRESIPSLLNQIGSRRLAQSFIAFLTPFYEFNGVNSVAIGGVSGFSEQIGMSLSQISWVEKQGLENLKPGSYFSELIFYFGFYGVLIIFLFLLFVIQRLRQKNCFPEVLVSLFMLFFLSTTTFLAPWVLLGLSLQKKTRLG